MLFLNNDIEVISKDWLECLLEHAQRPEVGAVGAKLYYPNHTIQHGGVILGIGGVAGHSHKTFPQDASGYFGRLKITQNLSAVTGACLMLRRSLFEQINGFDARFFLALSDVDLCLKLRQCGYLVVWTPYAELYHKESLTRGSDNAPEQQQRFHKESSLFSEKWATVLAKGDMYYNPNLTLMREDFGIKLPNEKKVSFL